MGGYLFRSWGVCVFEKLHKHPEKTNLVDLTGEMLYFTNLLRPT